MYPQILSRKDIVLVEDDEKKDAQELDKRQFSLGLDYIIKGWDDHAISSRTTGIRQDCRQG